MTDDSRKTPAGAAPNDADADAGAGADPTVVSGSLAERVPAALVLRWASAGTVGVLVVLLAAYGVYLIRSILVLVFIALFLAVSLEPAVYWLTKRGVRRSFAVTIVIAVLVALFGVFIWSIVPPLVDQGGKLLADLPGYYQRLSADSSVIREVTDRYHLTDRLTALLSALPGKLAGGAVGFIQRFAGFIASSLTVLVLTIYFMADLSRLQRGMVRLFPHRRRPRVAEILDITVAKVGGYMSGNIIISVFAGASTFVCLEIVRVPFALPLAVTVALTDLIPMTGGVVLGLVGAVIAIPVAAAIKVVISPTIATLDEPIPGTAPGPDPARATS